MSVALQVSFDAAIAAIAARQHSLITLPQVIDAGGTPKRIRYRIDTGRWIRIERSVYRIAGSEFTWHTRILATSFASGGLTSHRTSAALWGVAESPRGAPEISIPRGQSFRRRDVRVHESADLALANPRAIDGIMTTGIDRLIVDLGAVVDVNRLEEVVFDAINRKLIDWPDIWEALVLHARRGRNGIGRLRAVLERNYGVAVPDSKLEIILERLIADAGFPRPDRQVTIEDEDGPFARVDFGYVPRRLAIEVDGRAAHARRQAMVTDNEKRNRIRLAGWNLLVFTSEVILLNPGSVCHQLNKALARPVRA